MATPETVCKLCTTPGGVVFWQSADCRVVRVEHPDYPGYCRVIWHAHVREMTDLTPAERQELMRIVFAVESVVRACFSPDKINLACFGNMTPHVHWHIIPRWETDAHFPESIWGNQQRAGTHPDCQVTDQYLSESLQRVLTGREGKKK